MQQLPLVLGPGTSQSFANFIGEGNEAALAAVREARDGLYLWGPAGSGKSHLLRAAALGVESLIAVDLERDADGRVTGRIRGVPSFREGKTERVVQWLAGRGRGVQDFERVSVYSDSTNDLPLLELATHPVATNPSPDLEAFARQRGWPILNLFTTP